MLNKYGRRWWRIVRVCDAIMGSGKTTTAIEYINSHPNSKFIYITPYLDEVKRIKQSCPRSKFVEPSNRIKDFNFRKVAHTAALIKQGCNIVTTHQSFKNYTQEMLDDIREQNYVLIIDENVDILKTFDYSQDDLNMVILGGYVKVDEDGAYCLSDKQYKGKLFADVISLMKSRKLTKVGDKKCRYLYYWSLPPDLITAFKDVFILTYLFEGQSLHHLLKIYDIPYEYINVDRDENGIYRFTDGQGYTPKYVRGLKNKIHILDKEKLNEVGRKKTALSMAWFERGGEDVEQLKRNISNCFKNIWKDVPVSKRLWGAYAGVYGKMRGAGYTKAFLPFNAKATNAYRDRDHLVYIANCFMNVGEKLFYKSHGIEVDEDIYALSIMVQWIWRSAIRDGKDIYIYIPSKRMRTLLIEWVESLSKGGESNA